MRGRRAPAGVRGVACVSTTEPVPSPAVIRMTTVLGSGAVNTARTGTTTRPATLNDTSTSSASSSSVGVRSTSRSTKEYGWSQAPCQGSSRLATTSSGSHVPTPV